MNTLPNWQYLTGSVAQLKKVWRQYGIAAQILPAGGMIGHSDVAYVIDRSGRTRTELNFDPGPGTASTQASFAGELSSRGAAEPGFLVTTGRRARPRGRGCAGGPAACRLPSLAAGIAAPAAAARPRARRPRPPRPCACHWPPPPITRAAAGRCWSWAGPPPTHNNFWQVFVRHRQAAGLAAGDAAGRGQQRRDHGRGRGRPRRWPPRSGPARTCPSRRWRAAATTARRGPSPACWTPGWPAPGRAGGRARRRADRADQDRRRRTQRAPGSGLDQAGQRARAGRGGGPRLPAGPAHLGRLQPVRASRWWQAACTGAGQAGDLPAGQAAAGPAPGPRCPPRWPGRTSRSSRWPGRATPVAALLVAGRGPAARLLGGVVQPGRHRRGRLSRAVPARRGARPLLGRRFAGGLARRGAVRRPGRVGQRPRGRLAGAARAARRGVLGPGRRGHAGRGARRRLRGPERPGRPACRSGPCRPAVPAWSRSQVINVAIPYGSSG